LGPPTWIRWSFPRKISVPLPRGRKPLLHATSVLVEQVHDFLEIERRQPCVDRRLDVRMAEVFLHRAEVAVKPLERLRSSTPQACLNAWGWMVSTPTRLPRSLTIFQIRWPEIRRVFRSPPYHQYRTRNSGSLAAAPGRSFARYSLAIVRATSGSGTVPSCPPFPRTRRNPNCGW